LDSFADVETPIWVLTETLHTGSSYVTQKRWNGVLLLPMVHSNAFYYILKTKNVGCKRFMDIFDF